MIILLPSGLDISYRRHGWSHSLLSVERSRWGLYPGVSFLFMYFFATFIVVVYEFCDEVSSTAALFTHDHERLVFAALGLYGLPVCFFGRSLRSLRILSGIYRLIYRDFFFGGCWLFFGGHFYVNGYLMLCMYWLWIIFMYYR